LFFAAFPQDFPQPMKVKPDQLERLAQLLVQHYQAKGFITARGSDADIKRKIVEVIAANFAEEETIEEEARQMLASYARATKDMDPYKMFLIAKQKLAAKKGFVL
jgi:hypothetical protein